MRGTIEWVLLHNLCLILVCDNWPTASTYLLNIVIELCWLLVGTCIGPSVPSIMEHRVENLPVQWEKYLKDLSDADDMLRISQVCGSYNTDFQQHKLTHSGLCQFFQKTGYNKFSPPFLILDLRKSYPKRCVLQEVKTNFWACIRDIIIIYCLYYLQLFSLSYNKH